VLRAGRDGKGRGNLAGFEENSATAPDGTLRLDLPREFLLASARAAAWPSSEQEGGRAGLPPAQCLVKTGADATAGGDRAQAGAPGLPAMTKCLSAVAGGRQGMSESLLAVIASPTANIAGRPSRVACMHAVTDF
jgi:hypothetical protein